MYNVDLIRYRTRALPPCLSRVRSHCLNLSLVRWRSRGAGESSRGNARRSATMRATATVPAATVPSVTSPRRNRATTAVSTTTATASASAAPTRPTATVPVPKIRRNTRRRKRKEKRNTTVADKNCDQLRTFINTNKCILLFLKRSLETLSVVIFLLMLEM